MQEVRAVDRRRADGDDDLVGARDGIRPDDDVEDVDTTGRSNDDGTHGRDAIAKCLAHCGRKHGLRLLRRAVTVGGVLAPDVRFEGFTATDWSRFLSLFRPRKAQGGDRDPDRPRGAVFAVHGGGKLRKLLHSQAGRLRLDDVVPDWPLDAEALAQRHHASFAAIIEQGSLENVMEKFGARVRRGDDLTAQAILLLSLVRDEITVGRIAYWPPRLQGMPMPTPGMVSGTLDAVCPVGHAMLLGLFESGELYTSIAVRRSSSHGIDWIVGPDEIRRDVGLLAGDFRRDFRHLARTVDRKLGRLSLGVFAEASTFKRLQVDPSPGAWARAVAIRDVILSPVPAALAIPLGIDAGRAAFAALREIAVRADLLGIVTPTLDALRDRGALPGDKRDGGHLSMFGFEPLELLRRLLSRER